MNGGRKRYVGTSKKDANFPSRLDIGCPSCMKQAEAIIGFFGQPNKEFLLFYEPRPSKLLGSRKEKDSQTVEVRPFFSRIAVKSASFSP